MRYHLLGMMINLFKIFVLCDVLTVLYYMIMMIVVFTCKTMWIVVFNSSTLSWKIQSLCSTHLNRYLPSLTACVLPIYRLISRSYAVVLKIPLLDFGAWFPLRQKRKSPKWTLLRFIWRAITVMTSERKTGDVITSIYITSNLLKRLIFIVSFWLMID